jgi:hypothetical protein
VADAAVRQELLTTFTTFRANAANTPGFAAIAPSAVAGIAPGSLYYASDTATGTHWAIASFSATAAAMRTTAFVGFQDGGSAAVFRQPSGGSWQVESVGPCKTGLPVAVAAMWQVTQAANPMCPKGVPG